MYAHMLPHGQLLHLYQGLVTYQWAISEKM